MKNTKIHKVALLTDGIFPFVTGGMQKHSYYLLRELLKNGIEVILYHCGSEGERIGEQFSPQEQGLLKEVTLDFPSSPSMPGSYLRDSKKYSAAIAVDLAKREEVDFIYAQGFTAWRTLEMKKEGHPFTKIGVNFHGLEMYQFARGFKSKAIQRMFRPAVKSNCEMADVVYSLGGKLTGILEGVTQSRKIREIPIGVQRDWLRPIEEVKASPKLKAAFIGRYERRKGIEELNVVMKRLANSSIDFHLIGPIDKNKQVDMPHVTYHGLIKKEENIRSIFDDCDMLLVPSLAEGMPTVILEGMARGLTIVASDVGAVSIEVGDENGRLIKAGSIDELEKAIRYLASLPLHVLTEMKRTSRKKVENLFLWERIIDLTLQQMNEEYL